MYICIGIRVRDEFHLVVGGGGLKFLARIFSPLLIRISSGFAQILPAFWSENGYLENSSIFLYVISLSKLQFLPIFLLVLQMGGGGGGHKGAMAIGELKNGILVFGQYTLLYTSTLQFQIPP